MIKADVFAVDKKWKKLNDAFKTTELDEKYNIREIGGEWG